MERAGWVIETTEPLQLVIPGCPLDQIRVLDVLVLFDKDQTIGARADLLGALLQRLDGARGEIVGHTTFADLVARPRTPASDAST